MSTNNKSTTPDAEEEEPPKLSTSTKQGEGQDSQNNYIEQL